MTSRRDLAHCLLLAVGLLGIYHLGLLPDIPGIGDSAKFQLVGSKLGTPHASGYPLWVLCCNLFYRLLPHASPSYAANLLTALFSVGGTLFCFLSQRLLAVRPGTAGVIALTLALTPTLWSQSIVAEVYSLHYLFVTATVFFLLYWQKTAKERYLCLAIGIFALAFSNHQSTLWLAPAFGAVLWRPDNQVRREPRGWFDGHRWRWRIIAGVSGATVAAMTYGYIVWRTYAADPAYLEMQAVDARELLFQVTGGASRQHLFASSLSAILQQQLPRVATILLQETWPWLCLAVYGLWRRPGRIDWLLGLSAGGVLVFVSTFTVPDLSVHFIPLTFILSLYAGLGLERLRARFRSLDRFPAAALLLLLPTVQGALAWDDLGIRHRMATSQKADQILAAIGEQEAVLLSTDYNLSMALLYRSIWGTPQQQRVLVQHTPPIALHLASAVLPLRRYLQQDQPFRHSPTGRPIPPGLPVFAYCPQGSQNQPQQCAEMLRRQGISAAVTEKGLLQLASNSDTRADTEDPLPLLWVVHRLETVPTLPQALERLLDPTFDPYSVAIGLGPTQASQRQVQEQGLEGSHWVIRNHRPQALEVDVSLQAAGWLVIADSFRSRWSATVDGRPVTSLKINLSWAGIPVPAGSHRVRFSAIDRELTWRNWWVGWRSHG